MRWCDLHGWRECVSLQVRQNTDDRIRIKRMPLRPDEEEVEAVRCDRRSPLIVRRAGDGVERIACKTTEEAAGFHHDGVRAIADEGEQPDGIAHRRQLRDGGP